LGTADKYQTGLEALYRLATKKCLNLCES